MKKNRSFLLFLCFLLLSSCSSSKILSSWSDTTLTPYRAGTILIVGVAKDETKRRIYEDTFADSLKEAGITAIPSYTVSKQSIQPNEKSLRAILAKTKSTSVLITHMIGHDEKAFYQPGAAMIGSNRFYNSGLYGYYPFVYNSIWNTGSFITTTTVILETTIYDVQSEKRIWMARSESIDPVMTRKYYQELTDLFLRDLKKKNLL